MKKFSIKVFMVTAIASLGLGFVALPSTHAQVTPITDQGFGSNNAVGIAVGGTEQNQGEGLMTIVKNFINWLLGLLGLIALVMLLRGGFQMVTAAGDEEKYKAGFKILKQAAIGLAFIGISFFVVSMIFWAIGKVSGNTNETGEITAGGV